MKTFKVIIYHFTGGSSYFSGTFASKGDAINCYSIFMSAYDSVIVEEI